MPTISLYELNDINQGIDMNRNKYIYYCPNLFIAPSGEATLNLLKAYQMP